MVVAKILGRMITKIGAATVEHAANGAEALALYEASVAAARERERGGEVRFHDIILMDHEMPVMNGSDATRELRRLGYKGTIVGVSGNASLEQKGPFLASGLDIVLIKPVNRSELVEIFSIFECEKEQLEMAKSFEAVDGGGGGRGDEGGGGGNGNGKGRPNGNK